MQQKRIADFFTAKLEVLIDHSYCDTGQGTQKNPRRCAEAKIMFFNVL